MPNQFDEIARILASPMPRRRALGSIGSIMAGGLLAALGVGKAEAQADRGDRGTGENGGQQNGGWVAKICRPACRNGQICCPGTGQPAFCVDPGSTCCGNNACPPGETCCTGNDGRQFCSGPNRTCCGNRACNSNQKCCTSGARAFCVDQAATCCGRHVCRGSQTCCGGFVCCRSNETCCIGRACCGPNEACINGRCRPSRS